MRFLTSTFSLKTAAASLAVTGLAFNACAQTSAPVVHISDAWARATVPGQVASGAFMKLQADQATALVGASSPVAGAVELHTMQMDGDVMRMREAERIALPAAQTVELAPGGYHLMLQKLVHPLAAGNDIAVTLQFVDADGAKSEQTVQLPVRPLGGGKAGSHMPSNHTEGAPAH